MVCRRIIFTCSTLTDSNSLLVGYRQCCSTWNIIVIESFIWHRWQSHPSRYADHFIFAVPPSKWEYLSESKRVGSQQVSSWRNNQKTPVQFCSFHDWTPHVSRYTIKCRVCPGTGSMRYNLKLKKCLEVQNVKWIMKFAGLSSANPIRRDVLSRICRWGEFQLLKHSTYLNFTGTGNIFKNSYATISSTVPATEGSLLPVPTSSDTPLYSETIPIWTRSISAFHYLLSVAFSYYSSNVKLRECWIV